MKEQVALFSKYCIKRASVSPQKTDIKMFPKGNIIQIMLQIDLMLNFLDRNLKNQ